MKYEDTKFINELNEQLLSKKVGLTLTPKARRWLAENGHDPQYGARPLSRLMQTEIKDPLSDEILFGKLIKGGQVNVGIEADQLSFEYQ